MGNATLDARTLVEGLVKDLASPTLVAYATCSSVASDDARPLAEQWMSGEAAPLNDELERLTFLRESFDRINEEEGADMARALILGSLEDDTWVPQAIRHGRLKEVKAHFTRYLTDSSGY